MRSFGKCSRGCAIFLDCPPGLHFNPILSVCDYPNRQDVFPPIVAINPTYLVVLVHPSAIQEIVILDLELSLKEIAAVQIASHTAILLSMISLRNLHVFQDNKFSIVS